MQQTRPRLHVWLRALLLAASATFLWAPAARAEDKAAAPLLIEASSPGKETRTVADNTSLTSTIGQEWRFVLRRKQGEPLDGELAKTAIWWASADGQGGVGFVLRSTVEESRQDGDQRTLSGVDEVALVPLRPGMVRITGRIGDAGHIAGSKEQPTVQARLTLDVRPPNQIAITPSATIDCLYVGVPRPIEAKALDDAGLPIQVPGDTAQRVGIPITVTAGDPAALVVESSAPAHTAISSIASGVPFMLRATKVSDDPVTVTLIAGGTKATIVMARTAPASLPEPLAGATPIVLTEGETAYQIDARARAGQDELDWPAAYTPRDSRDESLVSITGTGVVRAKPGTHGGTAYVVVSVKDHPEVKPVTLEFNVQPRVGGIRFEPPSQAAVPGQTVQVRFSVMDGGTPPERIDAIRFASIEPAVQPADAGSARVEGDSLFVRPNQAGTLHVTLAVKDAANKVIKTGTFELDTRGVAAFRSMTVALDPMDETTAGYLFGKQTARQFHVLRVRMFNNLPPPKDGVESADSILAYSESVEVRVQLQKRRDRREHHNGAQPSPEDEWRDVDAGETVGPFHRALSNEDNPYPPTVAPMPSVFLGPSIDQARPVCGLAEMIVKRARPATASLFVSPGPGFGSPVKAEWLTSDSSVVSVLSSGASTTLQAKAPGFARIAMRPPTVPAEMAAWLDIAVSQVADDGARIVLFPCPLQEGARYTCRLVDRSGNIVDNRSARWHSDRPAIADINEDGVVTALSPGDTLIRAEMRRQPAVEMVIALRVGRSWPVQGTPSVWEDAWGRLSVVRHRFLYRPYASDLVLNSQERRQDSSKVVQAYNILTGLAQAASFGSTVNLLKGHDVPLFLDKFSNMLLPSIRRYHSALRDDLRDSERQNITAFAMRPLEEIPRGADLARVLFIPKEPIRGILPGYEVRVGSVDTSYFNVTVALVTKREAGNAAVR